MLNILYINESNNFSIKENDRDIFNFSFDNLSVDSNTINLNSEIKWFLLNDTISSTIFNHDNNIEIIFNKTDDSDQTVKINLLDTIKNINLENNILIIETEQDTIKLKTDNEYDLNSNSINILFNDSKEIKIDIYKDFIEKSNFDQVELASEEVSIMANPTGSPYVYEILPNSIIPEFTINLYDSSTFDEINRRPIYNGSPVISTLPSSLPASTNADYWYYIYGIGPEQRDLYVVATSNVTLENSDYNVYMVPPVVVFKITNTVTGEILIQKNMEYISNKQYKTNFTVKKSWGDSQKLLLEVLIPTRYKKRIPCAITIGTGSSSEIPIVNIYSE